LEATRKAKLQHYEPGSMIVTEGKDANAFYIVSKGTVDVVLPRKNQSDVVVVQLGPGKYFGEMEFFHERRNRASIRANEHNPVEVLAISYDQLNELLGQAEVAREALHQAANLHEQENVQKRGSS
jgi:CRP-like cAMP-binding protein